MTATEQLVHARDHVTVHRTRLAQLAVIVSPWALGGALVAVLLLLLWTRRWMLASHARPSERVLIDRARGECLPFVDATGAQAGGLLGDVRQDPFQSGGYESEPAGRVDPGAVHRAHGGVLFIDEITSLSLESQQPLLTALQERELAITGRHGGSSGAMVMTEPVPCDSEEQLEGARGAPERALRAVAGVDERREQH